MPTASSPGRGSSLGVLLARAPLARVLLARVAARRHPFRHAPAPSPPFWSHICAESPFGSVSRGGLGAFPQEGVRGTGGLGAAAAPNRGTRRGVGPEQRDSATCAGFRPTASARCRISLYCVNSAPNSRLLRIICAGFGATAYFDTQSGQIRRSAPRARGRSSGYAVGANPAHQRRTRGAASALRNNRAAPGSGIARRTRCPDSGAADKGVKPSMRR